MTRGDADPITTLEEHGAMVVMGVVTVESRVSNINPIEYFLEWVWVSGDQEILLTSYRDNEDCQFLQPENQRISYWNVTKTIWTDNQGTYLFRVYRQEEGNLVLENPSRTARITHTFRMASTGLIRRLLFAFLSFHDFIAGNQGLQQLPVFLGASEDDLLQDTR